MVSKASRASIGYISLVILVGCVILTQSFRTWTSAEPAHYLAFALIALVASGLKINLLPSVTMSMNFVFVLISIAEFSAGETLLMGCLAALVQCTFRTKSRPKLVQVVFSVASLACSIQAANAFHHASKYQSTVSTAVVLFLCNTLLIAGVVSLTERKNLWKLWRESYFWSFPNYLVGGAAAWLVGRASHVIGWQATLLLFPIVYVIYRSHSQYTASLEEAQKRAEQQRIHAEEVAALHRRTIETLALAIEAKDQTTHDHLHRVEIYAVEVGKELGLGETEIEALRAAALLHDIGKLAVPEYIISKPGKLTPEEFEKMKTHTVVGAEIVDRIQFPYAVSPMVRGHHEKWNGKGYPDGLAGNQIPIGARILAAVDCLDALASDRQYRRAMPLSEAIEVVRSESAKSFDPAVVEVLTRRHVELEQLANSGHRLAKLPTDVKVERGAAPAAGFEKNEESQTSGRDLANLHRSVSEPGGNAKLLAAFTAGMEECGERQAVLATLRTLLPGLVPYDAMAVYLRSGGNLLPECVDGDDFRLFASLQIPLGDGLSGWVAETGKAIVNGNPSVEPGYLRDPTRFSTLRSALAVPLSGSGGIIGVLSLYHRERDAFSMRQQTALFSVGSALAEALERTVPVEAAQERLAS